MIENLEQLYFDQIRDLYSAETQLIAALPELVASATNEALRTALARHSDETDQQRVRLEEISARRGFNHHGSDCDAMRGLIREAYKHMDDTLPGDVRDAVLVASGNRIEHYEIAGYGVARAFASALGYIDDADLLSQTLDEESAADEKITKIATGGIFHAGVNEAAIH